MKLHRAFVCAVLLAGCESAPNEPAPSGSTTAEGAETAAVENEPGSGRPTSLDHLGLAVRDLEATKNFFVEALGFRVTNEDADYPSAFVVNGHTRITLWQVEDPETAAAFDRRQNVGLHHFALSVGSRAVLEEMHQRIRRYSGATIEFAPEPLGSGPSHHMMFRDPSGIRMELIHRVP